MAPLLMLALIHPLFIVIEIGKDVNNQNMIVNNGRVGDLTPTMVIQAIINVWEEKIVKLITIRMVISLFMVQIVHIMDNLQILFVQQSKLF